MGRCGSGPNIQVVKSATTLTFSGIKSYEAAEKLVVSQLGSNLKLSKIAKTLGPLKYEARRSNDLQRAGKLLQDAMAALQTVTSGTTEEETRRLHSMLFFARAQLALRSQNSLSDDDQRKALADARRAAELLPQRAQAWWVLGLALEMNACSEEAGEVLRKALLQGGLGPDRLVVQKKLTELTGGCSSQDDPVGEDDFLPWRVESVRHLDTVTPSVRLRLRCLDMVRLAGHLDAGDVWHVDVCAEVPTVDGIHEGSEEVERAYTPSSSSQAYFEGSMELVVKVVPTGKLSPFLATMKRPSSSSKDEATEATLNPLNASTFLRSTRPSLPPQPPLSQPLTSQQQQQQQQQQQEPQQEPQQGPQLAQPPQPQQPSQLLRISAPSCTLDLMGYVGAFVIAGGSAATVALQVCEGILKRHPKRGLVRLILCNRSVNDILLRARFEQLLLTYPSFRLVHCITDGQLPKGKPATAAWWVAGRLSTELIESVEPHLKAVVSGPPGLCQSANELLLASGRQQFDITILDECPAPEGTMGGGGKVFRTPTTTSTRATGTMTMTSKTMSGTSGGAPSSLPSWAPQSSIPNPIPDEAPVQTNAAGMSAAAKPKSAAMLTKVGKHSSSQPPKKGIKNQVSDDDYYEEPIQDCFGHFASSTSSFSQLSLAQTKQRR